MGRIDRNYRDFCNSSKSAAEKFQEEMLKIKAAIPDASDRMISDFVKANNVRLYVVRIWAQQGVLAVKNGALLKIAQPVRTQEQIDIAVNALKKLSAFRCGAYFSFCEGSFSSDWTRGIWILSYIDETKDLAFLRKSGTEFIQSMQMESLYTGWLNGSAIIEKYEKD